MSRLTRPAFLIAALFTWALLATGTAHAAASTCPADACLVVNSNDDGDARDGVLTLTEALALDRGALLLADLTAAELGQVVLATADGLSLYGQDNIYFAPNVGRIILTPPVIGGQGAPPVIGGQKLMVPPVIGGQSAPPDIGGQTKIGMGWDAATGEELASSVIIDGSLMGATTGLRIESSYNTVRGLRFENFAGFAIEMVAATQGSNQIGGAGAEAVTYGNVGGTVTIASQ